MLRLNQLLCFAYLFTAGSVWAQQAPLASELAMQQFESFLAGQNQGLQNFARQPFAHVALTSDQVAFARKSLAAFQLKWVRKTRLQEMEQSRIKIGPNEMPFFVRKFGKRPESGWSLYLSMHGGGGAPARVNDSQWENQKRLYKLDEGLYVAPRAPTNTWNLWHQSHIDPLFVRLIENLVAFEGANWNRVYLMGYSAGGDGVYQLAPRMADRWAAAAMMAGHPNETSPLGLRNVPFALQVGGLDAAYDRNQIAKQWQSQLAKLHGEDSEGYRHLVKIYPAKGHWMDQEDAMAIPWMAKYTRNPTPSKVVWVQDDVTHSQHYWLGVNDQNLRPRSQVIAQVDGQTVTLDSKDIDSITVYLDDRFIDLDQPIVIQVDSQTLFEGKVERTLSLLAETFDASSDPNLSFPAKVNVLLPKRE